MVLDFRVVNSVFLEVGLWGFLFRKNFAFTANLVITTETTVEGRAKLRGVNHPRSVSHILSYASERSCVISVAEKQVFHA